ncbi:LPXTG cell wall anchor domain-containing protein [Streptomyces sp. NK08204]|uniref:LPXTG cell wall anchor domain-containing protein n=1 Tax=Streptomyces sp. NK08204 TaxID=2873260 RepID=UPI0027E2C445|nr:LPXTG cell wall anchor domain-containing protein [Streptomyces sp. NK08204]
MRLSTPLCLCSLCLVTAAVLVSVPARAAARAGAAAPSCAHAGDHAFPLATRIRGGPDSYTAGGGYGTWYIDLTNTTDRTCTDIHPVVVLTDARRVLRPGQPRLDFYDGSRPRPVTFAGTDEQELVGVLGGDGFRGFIVPPGKTISVKVRLALTADAVADKVTANAAVVQRRGQDGDWVGESNDYRFDVGPRQTDQQGRQDQQNQQGQADQQNQQGRPDQQSQQGRKNQQGQADQQSQRDQQNQQGQPDQQSQQGRKNQQGQQNQDQQSQQKQNQETQPGRQNQQDQQDQQDQGGQDGGGQDGGGGDASGEPRSPDGTVGPDATPPFAEEAEERARELASTGLQRAHWLLAAGTALLAAGGGAFLFTRRRR